MWYSHGVGSEITEFSGNWLFTLGHSMYLPGLNRNRLLLSVIICINLYLVFRSFVHLHPSPTSCGRHFVFRCPWETDCICDNHRSVYIYPDTVPPIHVVSYHVATDKPPSQDGDKFRSIFSDNLPPIATRRNKARGTILVYKHCSNDCSIKCAPLSHWGGSRHSQANVSQAAWLREFTALFRAPVSL